MSRELTQEQRQQIKAVEPAWREGVIEWVVEHERGWEVTYEGVGTFVLDKSHGHTPSPGQMFRTYEGGPYGRINGVDLDGEEVFYRTPAEDEALWAELAHWEAAKVRELNPNADEDYLAGRLPFPDAFALGAEEGADCRKHA